MKGVMTGIVSHSRVYASNVQYATLLNLQTTKNRRESGGVQLV